MPDQSPALYFHPDMLEGPDRPLVGRRSAGSSFLKGWLRCFDGEELRFVVDGEAEARACREIMAERGESRPLRIDALNGAPDFLDAGTVFFPTPGFSRAPWLRLRGDPARCSLVGITHTVSTRRIIEGLHALMSEPVEDWDAIICTSRAVRSVVARQFAEEEAFFRARFGATRVPQPQLPVIPLGIETADFAPRDGARARMRERHGAPEDAAVILTMGRLSVIEKANPLPLFLAAELLAERLGRPVHLWLCGWTDREEEARLHRLGAERVARNATVRIIDGRDPEIRRNIWAGADVFTLPADSIQETFGLVPVEAMAAGLPVVMPDWDGFRDTVRHGETGFLVPTRAAPPGLGTDFAARFADGRDGYLHYLTLVQSHVQIDVPAYAAALYRVLSDAGLRARLGAAAATHARETFDWSAVVPRYLDLARELAALRAGAAPSIASGPPGRRHPLEIDPFTLYADYPTERLAPDRVVALRRRPAAEHIALFDEVSGRKLYKRGVIRPATLETVIEALARGPKSATDIAGETGLPLAAVFSALFHLLKSDLARLPPPSTDP